MTLGAEPKKIVILGALVLVAGYLILSDSPTDIPTSPRPATSTQQPAGVETRTTTTTQRRAPTRNRARRIAQNFRPTLKPRRLEDRPDPMKVDPTLHLELVTKLHEVALNDAKRSLFDFSTPPLPKAPEPKILPEVDAKTKEAQLKAAEKRAAERKKTAANKPPPPINLKFYGFISPASATDKRAFFLDGENIFVASEGDVIDKRYKVVRIGVNSAVVEDTEHDHKQTLALVAENKG